MHFSKTEFFSAEGTEAETSALFFKRINRNLIPYNGIFTIPSEGYTTYNNRKDFEYERKL